MAAETAWILTDKNVIIIAYLIAANILGLLMMYIDKGRAKNHQWRIPERTLFIVAVLGGSIGSLMGMYLFHHKTKHLIFVVGMPLILVLQIALGTYLMGCDHNSVGRIVRLFKTCR